MKRVFVSAIGIAFAVFAGFGAFAEAPRPNVILIVADDLGYECLGAYGGVSYSTPNLDKMTREGLLFSNAYSQPLCTPTRVKLMTGRSNFRNYKAFGHLDPGEITFGHILQNAGYKTCLAGKWQLFGRHDEWAGKGTHPRDAGFDAYCVWQVADRGSRYADPLIETDTKPLQTYEDQYGPDLFLDFITDFVESNRENPFFVYYPMALVHNPFVPTPDSAEWAGGRDKKHDKHFADMMSYMDKVVGRIIAKVDELGLGDNTLILFTGDNGTTRGVKSRMADGSRIVGAKGSTVDAGIHVPLIARWKGVTPPGTRTSDLISFDDFFPTIVELAGATLPKDRVIDGVTFAPQLRGEKGSPREWVFCHYDPQWGNRVPARFAMNHRWKLYGDGRIFNLRDDLKEARPVEFVDLPTDAQHDIAPLQAVLDRMK